MIMFYLSIQKNTIYSRFCSKIKSLILFPAVILVLFCTGCSTVEVDYEGLKASPFPSSVPVVFYKTLQAVPESYVLLGHARYVAEPGTTTQVMLNTLEDSARAHGANGIVLTMVQLIPQGIYDTEEPMVWNPVDDSDTQFDSLDDYLNSVYVPGEPQEMVFSTLITADFILTRMTWTEVQ